MSPTAKDLFTEDQLFYMTLWWTEKLPGGSEHAPALLARYNKERPAFPPCDTERGREEQNPFEMSDEKLDQLAEWKRTGYNPADKILTAQQLDTFFDSLLSAITNNPKLSHTSTGQHSYIELKQWAGTASNHPAYPDSPFSDELEAAIAAAGIHRHALPQYCATFAHTDGQLFVPQNKAGAEKRKIKWEVVRAPYPGQPPLPYRTVNLNSADMDSCEQAVWETLYRVVPLRHGQTFRSGWYSVAGKRCEHEQKAYGDKVLLIGNNDVTKLEDLWTLSDDDILEFHPALRGSFHDAAEKYVPGYVDETYGSYVEATDRPNIIRHLLPGISFMIAAEPVQFHFGSSFATAAKGDFIIREDKHSTPRVFPKEWIDSGRTRFILPAPKPRFN